MICRKHTYGLSSIIRGKYSSSNIEKIQTHVDGMTNKEKEMVATEEFDVLWDYFWCGMLSNRQTNDKMHSKLKFNNNRSVIVDLIQNSTTNWDTAEWEFPKGRMQQHETDIECALREFEEETHISKNNINLIYNLCPLEEYYKSTNDKMYQITYFLSQLKSEEPDLSSFQEEEVSKMEWKDLEECLGSIRPCNQEKKNLISSLEEILNTYEVI
jgi:8-oxo-dGTP pyrophosphatase MutT (NUDIX family)